MQSEMLEKTTKMFEDADTDGSGGFVVVARGGVAASVAAVIHACTLVLTVCDLDDARLDKDEFTVFLKSNSENITDEQIEA